MIEISIEQKSTEPLHSNGPEEKKIMTKLSKSQRKKQRKHQKEKEKILLKYEEAKTEQAHIQMPIEGTRFFRDIFRTQDTEQKIGECVLNHNEILSTIYCPKCDKEVCIDCHLFQYERFEDHQAALKEIKHKLVETDPRKDNPHKTGFYVYTDVLDKLPNNIVINPEYIYAVNKISHFMKILRVSTSNGEEFAIKQIITAKSNEHPEEDIKKANEEYLLMESAKSTAKVKLNSLLTKNSGHTEYIYEILMENFGNPFTDTNFLKLDLKIFLQILRECGRNLQHIGVSNIFHGDIKMENILLNKKSYMAMIVDYGVSCDLKSREEVTKSRSSDPQLGPISHVYGLTQHMAPPELLHYIQDRSVNIHYSLEKIDIFCLGMTFLSMIVQDKFYICHQYLQELRSQEETQEKFLSESEELMRESLKQANWSKSYKNKIVEIIKCCLQPNYLLRPSISELCIILDIIHNLSVVEIKSFIPLKKYENNKITIMQYLYTYISDYDESIKFTDIEKMLMKEFGVDYKS